MRFWFKPRYIILSEEIPFEEKHALEKSIANVLVPVLPSDAFVRRLRQDLVAEAERQQTAEEVSESRILRVIGLVAGGILYVVGGVAVWLLWQHSDDGESSRTNIKTATTDSKRPSPAVLSAG
jgi:hypothetical protein